MKWIENLQLYFPDHDIACYSAVGEEWKEKGECAVSLCKKFNTVVQAGGNVGLFPIQLSKHFKNVITFEPDPLNLSCLYKNIEGVDNITVVEGALGSSESSCGMVEVEKNNCGANTIKEGEGVIPVFALDDLDIGEVNLIWLDIEGYEWKAIQGSLKTIKKYKPVIILENKGLIPDFGGTLDGSKKFVEEIESLGYTRIKRIMRDDFFIPN